MHLHTCKAHTQSISTISPSLLLFTTWLHYNVHNHTVPRLVAAGLRHPFQIREFKHQDAIPESLKSAIQFLLYSDFIGRDCTHYLQLDTNIVFPRCSNLPKIVI